MPHGREVEGLHLPPVPEAVNGEQRPRCLQYGGGGLHACIGALRRCFTAGCRIVAGRRRVPADHQSFSRGSLGSKFDSTGAEGAGRSPPTRPRQSTRVPTIPRPRGSAPTWCAPIATGTIAWSPLPGRSSPEADPGHARGDDARPHFGVRRGEGGPHQGRQRTLARRPEQAARRDLRGHRGGRHGQLGLGRLARVRIPPSACRGERCRRLTQ